MARWKKLITREYLESLGITNVTEDGKVFVNGYEVRPHKVWTPHDKSGNHKYYWQIGIYSAEIYKRNKERYKELGKTGKPTSQEQILLHRVVYAWFKGSTPTSLEYDVCHKDDNVDNNHIDNLYVDTHGGNIRKRKVAGGRYVWAKKN